MDGGSMTSTRRSALPAAPWIGLAGAVFVILPGAARAQPADLFYERTVMSAADSRCGLFTPEVSAALASAAAQARGAAIRAGTDPRDLAGLYRMEDRGPLRRQLERIAIAAGDQHRAPAILLSRRCRGEKIVGLETARLAERKAARRDELRQHLELVDDLVVELAAV